MNRQDILEFINTVIEEEHGNAVTEEQLLTECGIDSFGYAILWTSIEAKYGVGFSKEESNNIDYKTLTVRNMLDMIENKINETKSI